MNHSAHPQRYFLASRSSGVMGRRGDGTFKEERRLREWNARASWNGQQTARQNKNLS